MRVCASLFLVLFLVSAPAYAQTSHDELAWLQTELGLVIENGYVDPGGATHSVDEKSFARVSKNWVRSLVSLSKEDKQALRALSRRPDGRLRYFMVKVSDQRDELRVGYRSVFVGLNRTDELYTFLLENFQYHRRLIAIEQEGLRAKSGIWLEQDPAWQDFGEFRRGLRTARLRFNRLNKIQQDCVRGSPGRILIRPKRHQVEFGVSTSEIVLFENGNGVVSADQVRHLMNELAGRCDR